ncbi:MAG: DUF2953 domain-containing protein [Defluviitaleaceae bacterium]|nr:DUF2953 domain-containing protein [Defluviitaleaceae bacterium]
MIAAALNILGTIATVLLTILGVLVGTLLAGTAIVLFVPVRYMYEGNFDGKQGNGYAKASWLFGLMSIILNQNGDICVKLLGIRVWRCTEKPAAEETHHAAETPHPEEPSQLSDESTTGQSGTTEREPTKPTLHARLQWLSDEIKHIYSTYQSFKEYPDKQEIFSQTVLLLKNITKTSLPERLEIRGSFGFKDPCLTGQATGLVYALVPLGYPRIRLHITPDFTNEVCELKLLVYGKISSIALLIPICKFLLNKPVWKLVKKLIRR